MDLADIKGLVGSIALCLYHAQLEDQIYRESSGFFSFHNEPPEEQQVYCFIIKVLSLGLLMAHGFIMAKDLFTYTSYINEEHIPDNEFIMR